jgi:hypothetical protein
MKKISYLLFFLMIILIVSCKKYTARKIAGIYEGYIYNCHSQSASPSFYKADTIFGEFSITRDGKYVRILGEKIFQDSLADGEYIYTNGDCASSVKLNGDTLTALNCEYYNPAAYKYSGCYGVKVRD